MKNNMVNNNYKYGFKDFDQSIIKLPKGLNKDIIKLISKIKNEPKWMLDIRLQAYDIFLSLSNPKWANDFLNSIDFNDYIYYQSSTKKTENDWNKVPKYIKDTFNKLGIPEAEAKFLNGVSTQYDSEVIYKNLQNELEQQGVIFTNIETAIKKYPKLVKKYFASIVKPNDNKYAALNTAVWSGGSFIYVPKNVILEKPLQAYFRINGELMGQFERTLIIVENNASLSYIEGCTAPIYSSNNLHAAVVEVFVNDYANCQYITIQNWSDNVINLVTKRALINANAKMSWIDGNIGSMFNMKYPCSVLNGEFASSDCISIAVAKQNVIQDSGAKMIHLARNTKSLIIAKSISCTGGDTTYRGLVKISKNALNSIAHVECDTLILDENSRSETIPIEIIGNNESFIEHEAKISTISDKQLFYLMSKGIDKKEAQFLIIMGFIEPFSKNLPMEYAVELNRLIKIDIEGF